MGGMWSLELEWLERQPHPVWAGHLKRGEPASRNLQAMIDGGLIEAVSKPCIGYVITEKGRAYVRDNGQSEGK